MERFLDNLMDDLDLVEGKGSDTTFISDQHKVTFYPVLILYLKYCDVNMIT